MGIEIKATYVADMNELTGGEIIAVNRYGYCLYLGEATEGIDIVYFDKNENGEKILEMAIFREDIRPVNGALHFGEKTIMKKFILAKWRRNELERKVDEAGYP